MYEEHHAGECHCFKCTMAVLAQHRFKDFVEFTDTLIEGIKGSPFIRVNNMDYDVRDLIRVTMMLYSYCRISGDITACMQNVAGDAPIPPALLLFLTKVASEHARTATQVMAVAGIVITEPKPSAQ